MRGEPYGDDSAWQPDNLWFNTVYTHTHTHTPPSGPTVSRASRVQSPVLTHATVNGDHPSRLQLQRNVKLQYSAH